MHVFVFHETVKSFVGILGHIYTSGWFPLTLFCCRGSYWDSGILQKYLDHGKKCGQRFISLHSALYSAMKCKNILFPTKKEQKGLRCYCWLQYSCLHFAQLTWKGGNPGWHPSVLYIFFPVKRQDIDKWQKLMCDKATPWLKDEMGPSSSMVAMKSRKSVTDIESLLRGEESSQHDPAFAVRKKFCKFNITWVAAITQLQSFQSQRHWLSFLLYTLFYNC